MSMAEAITIIDLRKPGDMNLVHRAVVVGWPVSQSIQDQVSSQFEAALEQNGAQARVLTYDAGHAFANPSGARYDEKAATAAWAETQRFLADKLKGG